MTMEKIVAVTMVSAALCNAACGAEFRLGVGAYEGRAAFRELRITDNDGKVVYSNDFATPDAVKGWVSEGRGVWKCEGGTLEPPFAAAMLHPNGALAVGVFPRVKDGRWWTPRAEVSVDAAPRSGSPIGVFGEMSVLKVKGDLRADGACVFARDIVGGVWHDITGALAYVDGETILPGDILAKIGREAAPADIHSAPGTLVSTRLQS